MTPIEIDSVAILAVVTVLAAGFIVGLGFVHVTDLFDAFLLADFGPDTDPASAAHRPETETV